MRPIDWASHERWLDAVPDKFRRHGCLFLPIDEFDWSTFPLPRHTPPLAADPSPNGWLPGDELFVFMRRTNGEILGMLSVDGPLSGRRPDDADLRTLETVMSHTALALQEAEESHQALAHAAALEQLLLPPSQTSTGHRSPSSRR